MRTLLIVIFSTFTLVSSTAQVVKFKIFSASFKNFDESREEWGDWTDHTETDILGIIDADEDRIKIFTEPESTFDVIENLESRIDTDGDEIDEWVCIDHAGKKCGVRIVTLNSQNSRKQIYIEYQNFIICYNIYFLN